MVFCVLVVARFLVAVLGPVEEVFFAVTFVLGVTDFLTADLDFVEDVFFSGVLDFEEGISFLVVFTLLIKHLKLIYWYVEEF